MKDHNHIEEQFERSYKERMQAFAASIETPADLRSSVLSSLAEADNSVERKTSASQPKVVRLFKEYTFASVATILIVSAVAVISAIDFFGTQRHVGDKDVLSAWVAKSPFATNTLEAGTLSNLASFFEDEQLDVASDSYDDILGFFEQHGIPSTGIPRLEGVEVLGGKLTQAGEHRVAHLVLKTQDGHVLYMCSLPVSMIDGNNTSLSPNIHTSVENLGYGVQCNGDTSAAIAIWRNQYRVNSIASCISVTSIQEYIPR